MHCIHLPQVNVQQDLLGYIFTNFFTFQIPHHSSVDIKVITHFIVSTRFKYINITSAMCTCSLLSRKTNHHPRVKIFFCSVHFLINSGHLLWACLRSTCSHCVAVIPLCLRVGMFYLRLCAVPIFCHTSNVPCMPER